MANFNLKKIKTNEGHWALFGLRLDIKWVEKSIKIFW